VGFDVEMAQQLGRDLGVQVELVPVSRAILDSSLDPGLCDVLMSGVVVTPDRMLHVQFSQAYLDETIAFIVLDHQAPSFAEWDGIRRQGRLRIGVPPGTYFTRKVRDELGDVDLVPVSGIDDMFRPREPALDAFVATAERGSAYTILHPAYSVVVPKPRPMKVPLAYVVAGHDEQFRGLLDGWIDLKRKDGTIDELFAHWILGQQTTAPTRRWSVLRDVLHVIR
jgi:ABC-type amino acid transport substrate-binding protein